MTGISKGRNLVFLAMCIVLGVSILGIVLNLVLAENQSIVIQLIRFMLTFLLCYLVYSGKVLAKWIMIVLLGISCFTGILNLQLIFVSLVYGLRLLLITVSYLAVILILLIPKSVREYLNSQTLNTY